LIGSHAIPDRHTAGVARMDPSAAPPICVKLILVGPSGVGKTSLISAFLKSAPEPIVPPTITPAFSNAPVTLQDGMHVDLQIWDTAGQEKYVSVSQIFYRDSHVAFVCYDPEHPESLDAWVTRVREQVASCVILLVATKGDLVSDQEKIDLFNRSLTLIQKYNAKAHYLTSAVSGLNVPELFMAAAESARKPDIVVKQGVEIADNGEKAGWCC
jgi:small GTP-binding protein